MKQILIITLFLIPYLPLQAMEMQLHKTAEASNVTRNLVNGIRLNVDNLIESGLSNPKVDVNYIIPDDTQNSILHALIALQKISFIKQLLTYPNLKTLVHNAAGLTPLSFALKQEFTQGATLLIERDININDQNYDGTTPLHFAYTKKLVTSLIKKKVHLTIQSHTNTTPICEIFKCHPEIFTQLNPVFVKRIVRRKTKQNNTQLHLYAMPQGTDYAKYETYLLFLINNGLSIFKRNKDKKTPVDIACQEFNTLHEQYLQQKREYIKYALDKRERIMHIVLRIASPYTECAVLKVILSPLLPELIGKIMYPYYQLNIETIIAKKYKDKPVYYNKFIQQKNIIKEQLLTYPEPMLLWSK